MSYTLSELAQFLGAQLHGEGESRIERIATLANAEPGCLSFLANRRYRPQLGQTCATAVILAAEFQPACPVAALVVEEPYVGYARVATLLNPPPGFAGGIHPTAVVDPSAEMDESVWVGPNVVLEANVRVGSGVFLGPGCVVGKGSRIGAGSRLVGKVTVCHDVQIGLRALIHPGVVLGADGFGIANHQGEWMKVPQLGRVIIGDDVEIGANTTVDRGALDDTLIENGVKLDNLIQVAHGVRIGPHTAIAACVAIGGSARIGARCTIAGAASLAGHLEIADDVHLTATSAVPNSITAPGVYSSGMPVMENHQWRRNMIRLRQLDEIAKRVKRLERSALEVSADGREAKTTTGKAKDTQDERPRPIRNADGKTHGKT